jgi:hypothetical protein
MKYRNNVHDNSFLFSIHVSFFFIFKLVIYFDYAKYL